MKFLLRAQNPYTKAFLFGALFLWSMCFLVLGSSSTHALTVDEIATKVQDAYEKTANIEMSFSQETYVELLEKKVKKRGKITLKKPGKFRIIYEEKRGRHYYSDGQKLWIHQQGDHQVQELSLNGEEIPAEALSFLTGLGNLKREFAVESVDSKKWQGFNREKGSLHWLELTPLKKVSHIQWLVMGFDPQSFLVQEFYLLNEGGNLTYYRFDEIKKPSQLSDDIFVFKK
ncbi:MAG: outer membrane lipoprotein carrier protein LolA [Deltaproteobacteria bacterium]|nr:outer membrane lipoprotein carrier protein LolA [Deltaproteobacteria bacterium]